LSWSLTEQDRLQAEALGISEAQIRSQILTFQRSSFFVRLARPCTVGDGIRSLAPEKLQDYVQVQQRAARQGRFLKFVPASGAATRMFQIPSQFYYRRPHLSLQEIRQQAAENDADAASFIRFLEELRRFAFFDDLKSAMQRHGLDLEDLLQQGRYPVILEYLLTSCGLGYEALPKGLLKFHRYGTKTRTAFEEHLVEAALTVRDANGVCRLHCTVSSEHQAAFRELFARAKSHYEDHCDARFEVEFSVQSHSSDTIAVDLDNQPFRDGDGRLLFRPGGHGALLENLNSLGGDLITLKNIDNVVPDRLKPSVTLWKQVLGGVLVVLQDACHHYLKRLTEGPAASSLFAEAITFAEQKLLIQLPETIRHWSFAERREFLVSRLNRPMRVCGMVRNVGEPGGGPFWVMGKDGALSLQVVESAQVDMKSSDQQRIWNSATHFNPVDIICAVRDYRGRPFNLRDYVDQEAVFIARKSSGGRELKALELPGLWNGAMSDWITVFVEVPRITFQPVKTANALLEPEHAPE